MPKGLLYADEDIVLQAPELKIMQGGLSVAATLIRMLDAFDWQNIFPFGEDDSFDPQQVGDPASQMARLESIRDRRNASYLVVVPERDHRLKDAKDPLTQAWAHIQTGFDWGRESMTDGSGIFHMGRLTPRAAEIVGGYVAMMGAAFEGPAVVPDPTSNPPTNISIHEIFSGRFNRGEYEPYQIDADEPTYVTITGVDQFWPSLFNAQFDKRVFTVPGMLEEPAEVDLFGYSEADGQQLENATGMWAPLKGLISRNW